MCVQVYLCMCSYTDMQAEEPEDNPGCHFFFILSLKLSLTRTPPSLLE